MANILFANNASTALASPISSGATACTLVTGTGAEFPNPTGGQYFVMTFVDAATGLLNEIVRVTARSGDTCTIVRAQEGTTALAWLAGDTAANFMTAGSIAALQSGFPTGSGSISTNTTLSLANTGNFYRVSGTGTVVSLPAASSVSGMVVGFSCAAAGGCTVASLGGTFAGGAPNGTTSISLAATDFVCAQSNGSLWSIFAGSPDILVSGIIAIESWVTANFDPLGAAVAAQANAEAYALSLQGNLENFQTFAVATVFGTADFGKGTRFGQAALAAATFTYAVPPNGAFQLPANDSAFNLHISSVGGGNIFYGWLSASGYVPLASAVSQFILPPGSAAMIYGTNGGNWYVPYNSSAFAPYGQGGNVTVFDTPGTFSFTVSADVYILWGEVVGGGAAGGGSNAGYNGGAGGAGGFAAGQIAVTPGQTISVVVGAGGTTTTGNGGNGGTSSCSSSISATGGSGGRGSGGNVAGGFGGTGTAGTLQYEGGAGTDGTLLSPFTGGSGAWTGVGGASYYGGGGRSGTTAGSANGAPGSGGGASYANSTATAGQPGSPGQVIIRV